MLQMEIMPEHTGECNSMLQTELTFQIEMK